MPPEDAATAFEAHRAHLFGLAYRMLGSVAEAEDAVQDAFVRWQGSARDAVDAPRAFLSTIVTRLAIDRMKSARARRETYVGPWLPEPLVDDAPGPDAALELADDVTYSLLLALERLSPLERAAFLLHDAFDMDYVEIAAMLDRSEAGCRQLVTRARRHVRDAGRRQRVARAEAERLTQAFLEASRKGDAAALKVLLAEHVAFHADGGGLRQAALNVIRGIDKVTAFFVGVAGKTGGAMPRVLYRGAINAAPGLVTLEYDGLPQTTALEVRDGRIAAIYVVRNPDKLGRLPVAP